MSDALTYTLATLRGSRAHRSLRRRGGHAEADATLQGGLARGALHEVFAAAGRMVVF
jgi:protein ImuA